MHGFHGKANVLTGFSYACNPTPFMANSYDLNDVGVYKLIPQDHYV